WGAAQVLFAKFRSNSGAMSRQLSSLPLIPACTEPSDFQKSPVQPTCADGRDTYREIWRWESARPQGRVRDAAPNFAARGIRGGRNFCPAQQAEMGSPWSVALLRHAEAPAQAGA